MCIHIYIYIYMYIYIYIHMCMCICVYVYAEDRRRENMVGVSTVSAEYHQIQTNKVLL